jgi:hypothetical protein
MFDERAKRPKFHDAFSFKFHSSAGTEYAGQTEPREQGFGFTVLWNSFHPERARVSLNSYTLESRLRLLRQAL